MRTTLIALASGLLFGAGLVVSGMAEPAKVLAFLTLNSQWNPALAFVMGGALAVTLPGFAWIHRRGRLLNGNPFPRPVHGPLDRKLMIGALLFGLGWGLSGYCPGPAIVSAGLGHLDALLLLPAMLMGTWLARRMTG